MLTPANLDEMQIAAIDRLYEHDETLLIAGLGAGKAIIGLTAINQLLADDVLNRVLVLAPKAVAQLTWGVEPDKWSHITEEVAIACGTPAARRAAVESEARIVVCNFDNVGWIVDNYGHTFDGVLIDEMTKLKQAGGVWVKKLRRWTKGLTWRAGMTGTPLAETGQDIYTQALLLDGGAALGNRKDSFLRRYFEQLDYQGYRWGLKPGAEAAMAERLRALVYMADDAGYKAALPDVTTHLITCQLTTEGVDAYKAIEAEGCWGEVEAVNAAVVTQKLQQIAAGGLYAGDDRTLVWQSDHKATVLRDLMNGISEPVIIVYNYEFEREMLRGLYPDAPCIGDGGVDAERIAAFNAGTEPVLLMHWRAGSHGLNLQGACRVMIHTSPLWAADGWIQTIGRIRRRGQLQDCRRYVLVTAGTVEEEMLGRLGVKAENEARFMAALQEVA